MNQITKGPPVRSWFKHLNIFASTTQKLHNPEKFWIVIECSCELCFFSLLNCNTQIRTPTRGLPKPLLPSKTAYARVTFQEVPTRLPPRKLLQRSRDVITILVQKRNRKNWKMTILWVTCERKAEASSRVEHCVMM